MILFDEQQYFLMNCSLEWISFRHAQQDKHFHLPSFFSPSTMVLLENRSSSDDSPMDKFVQQQVFGKNRTPMFENARKA